MIVPEEKRGSFCVAFDPLDGSSNIVTCTLRRLRSRSFSFLTVTPPALGLQRLDGNHFWDLREEV